VKEEGGDTFPDEPPAILPDRYDVFVEPAGGYVKALEKSTSSLSTMREVFEHCTESYSASGKETEGRFEGSVYL
jgi:hypothetical protein